MKDMDVKDLIVGLAKQGLVNKAAEVAERSGLKNAAAELITEGIMSMPKV